MSNDKRVPPDDEETESDDSELSDVPLLEDHREVDPDTGKSEWVPYMLAPPPMPDYAGPVDYAGWPRRYKDGKGVEATDVDESPSAIAWG